MSWRRLLLACVAALGLGLAAEASPVVDPELSARLRSAASEDLFGVILTFEGARVTDAQVEKVRALGISGGYRMRSFPILAFNARPAQIAQMMGWGNLRSIYLNSPLELYLHQTKPLIGVDRLRADAALTQRNGGQPVEGRGVTIAINDTGIDGTHPDVPYDPLNPRGGKTVQNVILSMSGSDGLIVRSDTLGNVFEGIIEPVYVEGVANTDTHGGHGTHVASTAAGTGAASQGLYRGVAPGANLLGLGSGAGIFVVGQIAAFDYCYQHQFQYNIRVVNNSWGNSAVALDPDHPVNVASKMLHDDKRIVVVFANGNDGPDPNSQNRWASWPWTLNVGAATKDGRVAPFSSRGIFGDAVVRPTILAPGTGGPAEKGLTSAVVAARARVNPAANGLHEDAQIPPAFLPNYTQISGTSMAAPHLAGVAATILSADPSLLPGDVKAILERTATPLAAYDEFEAGAGLANVHAAVDLVFNPGKPYGDFGFAGKGLTLTPLETDALTGSVEPGGSSSHQFDVPANARFTFVQLDWGGAVGEDEIVVDNTNLVLQDLALAVEGGGKIASSDDPNLGGLFGAREGVKLEFPSAGTYTANVSAGILQLSTVTPQPYRLTVRHYLFDPNEVVDLDGLDDAARASAYRLVYDRVMAADGGYFRPADDLTRIEFGRALMFGARVPQFIPDRSSFIDVAHGSRDSLVAESLRREGVLGLDGLTFGAGATVRRLEAAVALVRALRLDAQARARAGTTVKSGGEALTDNAQIPLGLRGYVQIALDRGLLRAFPAEVREIAPGVFQAVPGPRFEPSRALTRGDFVEPATRLLAEMFGE